MQRDDPKAAFILPHYTANFYAPNENVLDQIKTNPAVDFLQAHADFESTISRKAVRRMERRRTLDDGDLR
jgi:hypothetical protein